MRPAILAAVLAGAGADWEAIGVAWMALAGLALSALYCAPAGVAAVRGHPNLGPILVVNVLLGWSVVGWVVALAWSVSAFDRRRGA